MGGKGGGSWWCRLVLPLSWDTLLVSSIGIEDRVKLPCATDGKHFAEPPTLALYCTIQVSPQEQPLSFTSTAWCSKEYTPWGSSCTLTAVVEYNAELDPVLSECSWALAPQIFQSSDSAQAQRGHHCFGSQWTLFTIQAPYKFSLAPDFVVNHIWSPLIEPLAQTPAPPPPPPCQPPPSKKNLSVLGPLVAMEGDHSLDEDTSSTESLADQSALESPLYSFTDQLRGGGVTMLYAWPSKDTRSNTQPQCRMVYVLKPLIA